LNHLLSVLNIKENIATILENAAIFKGGYGEGEPLKDMTLAMIFEKSSTRTRVSFEVAMIQLGGTPLYLSASDLQLGRGELIEDTARAMSRYVDGVMIRAREHEDVKKFAEYSSVPVINGLTNLEHPCQALADVFTVLELKETLNVKMVYVGDGNNVANSLLLATSILGMDFTVACPKGYEPDENILSESLNIAKSSKANINIINDPFEAVKDADVVYTDVWVSMGDEKEEIQRVKDLQKYQINDKLLESAVDDAIVMHCLPAIRGQEITEKVLNGPKSVVWDQAENRLHVQKAILYEFMR
jgi:ornithine carbamoyltransferase